MPENKNIKSECETVDTKAIYKKSNVIIWGIGRLFNKYRYIIEGAIQVKAYCDRRKNLLPEDCTITCITPDQLQQGDYVIISMQKDQDALEAEQFLDARGIVYCHLFDVISDLIEFYDEKQILRFDNDNDDWPQKSNNCDWKDDKIKKFVGVNIPWNYCNLECPYCYIRQLDGFRDKTEKIYHRAELVARALSPERIGGCCIINFSGSGETLLFPDIVKVTELLTRAGQYVSLVTNGTLTDVFEKIVRSGADLPRIFFKFSLHYIELKRKELLEDFAKNVKRICDAGCSFTIELTADDEYVPYIDEIIDYSEKNFGAKPHLTVPRDDTNYNRPLITNYSINEYKKIWSVFDSPMLEFKLSNIGVKRDNGCLNGLLGCHINYQTGDAFKCYGHEYIGNIYQEIDKSLSWEKIDSCPFSYCFNCHSQLSFGLIPEVAAPRYTEMRDRIVASGRNWLTPQMKHIFNQRVDENNEENLTVGR